MNKIMGEESILHNIKKTEQFNKKKEQLTGLPLAPSSPGAPLTPGGPAAPGEPESPFSPASPLAPWNISKGKLL